MPIHLCIVYGCFRKAELSSCARDPMAHKAKNIYLLFVPLQKEFANPWLI